MAKPVAGKTFLFTGTLTEFTRAEAEAVVKAAGGEVASRVTAELDYLVAGEKAGNKLAAAKKRKTVTIMTEEEFRQLLGIARAPHTSVAGGRLAEIVTAYADDYAKLRKAGLLVDLYSSAKSEKERRRSGCRFSDYEFSYWDAEAGTAYRSKLWLIFIEVDDTDTWQMMTRQYPRLAVRASSYKPDFLFLNFHTDQVLCVGLGRRMQLFAYELDTYASDERDSDYLAGFRTVDPAGLVPGFLDDLSRYGGVFAELWCLPGASVSELQGILKSAGGRKRKDKAAARFEVSGADEPLSRTEVEELLRQHQSLEESLKGFEEELLYFFPKLASLNLRNWDF